MQVACIIPTYNGEAVLTRLFDSLEVQSVSFDTFIIDSSSSDRTQELIKSRFSHMTVIRVEEFNHGGTRQLMVDNNPDYDVYIFLTQDAYLADSNSIANMVKLFTNPKVGAVCGRQLPHVDANPLAQHARYFNYPEGVQIKFIDDVLKMGIKTAFVSNSFAAYRGEALKAVGGFPPHVIFAEDMYVASKMLLSAWHIAYAGNAICYHSHNYKIFEEFKRYFDMGVFHAREPWIRQRFGGAGAEGIRFIKSELLFLGFRRIYLWPIALLRNAMKLIGYKLGQKEAQLPLGIKRKLGMHTRYWDSQYAVLGMLKNAEHN